MIPDCIYGHVIKLVGTFVKSVEYSSLIHRQTLGWSGLSLLYILWWPGREIGKLYRAIRIDHVVTGFIKQTFLD